jgi:hypothetical protein
MFDESANGWRTAVRTGGHVAGFLAGLLVVAFGLGVVGVCVYGLAMPDAELVQTYVQVIAGAKVSAALLAEPQRMITLHHFDACMVVTGGQFDCNLKTAFLPVLAWAVIGVRLVLVAALLLAVGVVNQGWKFWR